MVRLQWRGSLSRWEEQLFDREEVLGRDLASVFPNEVKKEAGKALEAIKDALGSKRFITEKELEGLKKSRGLNVDDGTLAALKPLAEVLAENKAKREAEFEQRWRMMKQGKNRPLDEDELDFLESLNRQEAEKLREWRNEELRELEAFRKAAKSLKVEEEVVEKVMEDEGRDRGPMIGPSNDRLTGGDSVPSPSPRLQGPAGPPSSGPLAPMSKKSIALPLPAVKLVPRVRSTAEAPGSTDKDHDLKRRRKGDPDEEREDLAKTGDKGEDSDDEGGGGGLADLLGGYGSSSEEE